MQWKDVIPERIQRNRRKRYLRERSDELHASFREKLSTLEKQKGRGSDEYQGLLNTLQFEASEYEDELNAIESKELVTEAKKHWLDVSDIPEPAENMSHWETGDFGDRYLFYESRAHLEKLVVKARRERSKERREHGSFWFGIIAALMGISLTFYNTFFISSQQLLLAKKPLVDFDTEIDTEDLPVGIRLLNAGPGAATIKSLTYFIDKKPVGNVEQAMNLAGLDDGQFNDLEENDTLASGEKLWLFSNSKKPHGKKAEKQLEDFADFIDRRLAVKVEFCSIVGKDCFKKCSKKGFCGDGGSVSMH